MDTSSIPQLFKAVDLVVFYLGSNPAIQPTMSRYGFTPKRVQESDTLLKTPVFCKMCRKVIMMRPVT